MWVCNKMLCWVILVIVRMFLSKMPSVSYHRRLTMTNTQKMSVMQMISSFKICDQFIFKSSVSVLYRRYSSIFSNSFLIPITLSIPNSCWSIRGCVSYKWLFFSRWQLQVRAMIGTIIQYWKLTLMWAYNFYHFCQYQTLFLLIIMKFLYLFTYSKPC